MRIELQGREIELDEHDPIDISIPLYFNGPQPSAYGVEPASSRSCEYGDLVGDTRRGGSCNFEQITVIPHCNGTHTECVGHITNERISVRDCLQDVFIPAVVISVSPTNFSLSGAEQKQDFVITAEALASALEAATSSMPDKGLIIRTLPNEVSKLTRRYGGGTLPPYFDTDAMEYIVECGFKHLLVDLPSIDRLYDEGKLVNHRLFWNVEPDSFELNSSTRYNSTITELIYVPDAIKDGEYLLNLQIAPFASDASPSRPVIFKVK